ncbi:MAG: patatin-like phospholipase family protein, partial [Dehalococcoidia bacterium]
MLVRVPLLFGLALFLVPAAALGFDINMLASLFALSRGREVFTIILLGLLAAWLCGMSSLLIWEYAPQRMHHLTLRLSPFWQNRRILRVLPFTVLALPLMTVIWRNVENHAPRLGPMVLGVIAALLVVGLVVLLRAVVLDRLEAFITDRVVARVLQWIPRSIWAGYIEVEEAGRMHFRAGHGTATAILIVLAMAYWYGDRFLRPGQVEGSQLPALAYLLVLLMLLVSLLSGTSFFLDRFRLPLLLSLILWSFLSYGLNTDHTFPVRAVRPYGLDIPSAGESIEPWLAGEEGAGREKPTLLVVCASGGGIQASAWTARLLTWLQEDLGEPFTRSIRLISSVSGGSLGTLYFLEAFEKKRGAPAPESLETIRRASSSSSLSATAWGLVFPDFQRAFFRFFVNPATDRASAMEQAWRLALRLPNRRPIDTRLSQWTAQVRAGELPATVFNSFIVETGQRMLFNTVDISMTRRARTFAKLYGQGRALDVDIDVITAARLSATFAYVTPIARAQWQGAQPATRQLATDHLADGGYFDNFGVLTAVE